MVKFEMNYRFQWFQPQSFVVQLNLYIVMGFYTIQIAGNTKVLRAVRVFDELPKYGRKPLKFGVFAEPLDVFV